MKRDLHFTHVVTIVAIIALGGGAAARAETDAFVRPYRTSHVAAVEVALVETIHVKIGQLVKQGELLVTLDHDTLSAALELAERAAAQRGRLEAAQIELQLKQTRHAKLTKLLAAGHSQQEEVDRCAADIQIARAMANVAENELQQRIIDARRARSQLDRRFIRAPFDGVVSAIQKEVGEQVAPNSPELVVLVQTDRLLVTFTTTVADAKRVGAGQPVQISIDGQPAEGVVEAISPVIDAESGTIAVRVAIDNPNRVYWAGQRCVLRLDEAAKNRTSND
ncbi:MAG: efflux RND transporter periplasmic adaptor subunit [Pirellulaceae bacterium]|jgi:RND family efflux transporter MFP subunit|nr:efflux RND transporter periplasmic adaptor subunit [Pirellulaceae bacterium]